MDVFLCLTLLVLTANHVSAELLYSTSGEVGRGNFSYYSLMYTGFISLELHTTHGDCDLYISQLQAKPSFDPNAYCLHSATCGSDSIVIPKSFQRPIGIGIYGHPLYEVSSYLLFVHRIDGVTEIDEFTDELSLTHNEEMGNTPFVPRSDTPPGEDEPRQESFLWVLLWSIFDVLIEILFL